VLLNLLCYTASLNTYDRHSFSVYAVPCCGFIPSYYEWHAECRITEDGHEYFGRMNTTWRGEQCQSWSSNTPNVQDPEDIIDENFPDGSVAAAENYCRNPRPDSMSELWCHTIVEDVIYAPCDIPLCIAFSFAPALQTGSSIIYVFNFYPHVSILTKF